MSAPTADALATIRPKIKRANKHIADLDREVRDFLDSDPYKFGAKRDPDTRKLIYYVSEVREIRAEIVLIAEDAIGNLVSVLDRLAFRLYRKNTPKGDGRGVYFPIAGKAKCAAEYIAARQGKVKGIHPNDIAAIDALEPYQGGKGHQLWVLNELNNLSKHRDLIAVGARFWSVDFGAYMTALLESQLGHGLPNLSAFYKPADILCPLKVGHELLVDRPDAEFNEKMKFTFQVVFNEPQIIQAEPLVETVHHLANLVDRIVSQFAPLL